MMDLDFFGHGILFAAAVWVLCSSVWRINLMRWGAHQCLQLAAYLVLALWAASYVLGLPELQPLGVVGVAMLFFSGRKRWLTRAPDDTERLQ